MKLAPEALIAGFAGLALVLGGCGGVPTRTGASGVYGTQPAKRGGGYYKDDGPGDRAPDIALIEDPEPRLDPLNRFANNPYSIEGRSFTPMRAIRPFTQKGIASWYGRRFDGQRTSSGEVYDMYAMTAAHPTLPIPSYARVTNLQNGRSVVVRVNDRGPFLSDRVIDLSYTAAAKLGYVQSGSAPVELELIQPQDFALYARAHGTPALASRSFSIIASAQAAEPAAAVDGGYLQLGAFSSRDNAEVLRLRVARELPALREFVRLQQRESAWRVWLGPYASRDEALADAAKLREAMSLDPIFVAK